ncbi:MAG: hypothetical protein ACK2T6_00910 [Anaerolineae bacterium]|jgi:hypothetical protein
MGMRWQTLGGWLLVATVVAAVGGAPRPVEAGSIMGEGARDPSVAERSTVEEGCLADDEDGERCKPIEIGNLGALAAPVARSTADDPNPGLREPERPFPDPRRRNLEPPQRQGPPPVEPRPRGPQLPPMPKPPTPGEPGRG